LDRTWTPFFGRFGRLTTTQRTAIPPIVEGRDTLVCAATASGKTEAACAPLVERHLSDRVPWMILYISPTRALVNDLYERLLSPLGQLGLRVDRRTGEYKPSRSQDHHVLLTTPESFDSMLCRGRQREPEGHLLERVVAVVLDEIHLLHGSPRGEQLRWLLERLRRLRRHARSEGWTTTEDVQIVALSATVPDPDMVRRDYLPNGEILLVPGSREIEVVVPKSESPEVEVALPAYLADLARPEKVLVFSNARRRVDDLTAAMRPRLRELGFITRAHHGSLEKHEREETEELVKNEVRIVAFATSTLEIGIDIGDIDLVVLDGPAPDIPSLLQRIGRGNRRTGMTRVMACATGTLEGLVQSAMIDAARDGWLGKLEHGPQHAVARQQVASYIKQSPRVTRSRPLLQELLDTCAAPIAAQTILRHMLSTGELVENPAGIGLGDELREVAAKGDIHSNIDSSAGAAVMDELTGRVIATGIRSQAGRGMRPGGHLLEVRKWNDFRIEVRRVRHEDMAAGDWRYASQRRLESAGQPEAVRRFLGIPDDVWPIVVDERGSCVFHLGGARRQAAIELAAAFHGHALGRSMGNAWFLRTPSGETEKPEWLTRSGPAALTLSISDRLDTLERLLGRPKVNKRLPPEVRVDEVQGWLQIEAELASFRRTQWQIVQDPELRKVLLSIASVV
jgi:ATP-dependent Lhr-like helicase